MSADPARYAAVQQKIATLQAALLAADPQLPMHLKASHELLQSYPETVHLLTDDEIKTIVDAAQSFARVRVVEKAAKKAATGRGKRTGVDLSDL